MEIPQDSILSEPYLQIYGKHQINMENSSRILKFEENRVLIQCHNCQLEVRGKKLMIQQYSSQELIIDGIIEHIIFL